MGSSGSLLYRGFGAEINAHDVVVRINGAVTAGYENDCGVARQPGIVTGWWKGLEDAERAGSLCCGAHALVSTALAIGPSGTKWPEWYERAVLQAEAAGATTTRLSRSFMKQTCHEQILGGVGNWPSTGFIALAAALAVAQECIHIHTNIRLHTHTYTYPVAYTHIRTSHTYAPSSSTLCRSLARLSPSTALGDAGLATSTSIATVPTPPT